MATLASKGSSSLFKQDRPRHLPVLTLLFQQTESSEALSMPFDLYGAIL